MAAVMAEGITAMVRAERLERQRAAARKATRDARIGASRSDGASGAIPETVRRDNAVRRPRWDSGIRAMERERAVREAARAMAAQRDAVERRTRPRVRRATERPVRPSLVPASAARAVAEAEAEARDA